MKWYISSFMYSFIPLSFLSIISFYFLRSKNVNGLIFLNTLVIGCQKTYSNYFSQATDTVVAALAFLLITLANDSCAQVNTFLFYNLIFRAFELFKGTLNRLQVGITVYRFQKSIYFPLKLGKNQDSQEILGMIV